MNNLLVKALRDYHNTFATPGVWKHSIFGQAAELIDRQAVELDALRSANDALESDKYNAELNLQLLTDELTALREAQQNNVLSLDELRGMLGTPVWIVQGNEALPEETETILVELFRDDGKYILYFSFGEEREDGLLTARYSKTWRAYRHKPTAPKEVNSDVR